MHLEKNNRSIPGRSDWINFLPFALVVAFASSALLQEHLGLWAIGVHLLLILGVFRTAPFIASSLPRRWTPWLILAVLAGLVVLFVVVYPIEHGKGFGRSSDRDDALNVAVERIIDGQSPYYPQSDRAGPLSLFPGAIVMAMPFAVAGNSAWQNLFWLPVFLAVTAFAWRNREAALVWLAALLAVSPAIQYEFISGGDMLANSIYIPCAAMLLLAVCEERRQSKWMLIAAAAFFGLALTSRPNFAFVFPLVMAGVVTRRDGKTALALGGISVLVASFLTFPLYLRDPQGFTPLPTGNKLSNLDAILPHASLWLAGAAALATGFGVVKILRRPAGETAIIWKWCSLVLLVPMAGAVFLRSFSEGRPDFGFMHDRYGLMPMFFAFWGWLPRPIKVLPGNDPESCNP